MLLPASLLLRWGQMVGMTGFLAPMGIQGWHIHFMQGWEVQEAMENERKLFGL